MIAKTTKETAMAFNLQKFFQDIFNPQQGEVVTVMHDLPHGNIQDIPRWQERRAMAKEWRDGIDKIAGDLGITVNPLVTYLATGANNADLPKTGRMNDKEVSLDELVNSSTIIIVMPQFSATAPLKNQAKKHTRLRVGSMPGCQKFMEETGLSADYQKIAERCKRIAPYFEKAVGGEVTFSTGHKCYFDLSNNLPVHKDDGILHAFKAGTDGALSNLPAGEVFVTPNERPNSKTSGELPHSVYGQTIVYVVKENRIVDIRGTGPEVEKLRNEFTSDPAWRNIAEFAIGCNDKAKVTGIVLEDEKAGFHWAYGRSDHFGGINGVSNFTSPSHVVHQDVVYAKDSPISCKLLEVVYADGKRDALIRDGEILV